MLKKIKIRILLWLGLFIVVGWFLYMGIVPGGEIVYINDFEEENDFVRKLTPLERVESPEQGSQKVIGNPVYFTLRTPRTFDQAKVSFRYQNEDKLPLLEAGILVDKTVWRYDLKPLENALLDQIDLVWEKIEENGVTLWQKEKKFDSIEDFLADLPATDKIAVYNFDLKADYVLADYKADDGLEKLENFRPMIGAWQAYTYVKDEELNFQFEFTDQNQNDDSDPVEMILYYNNQIILQEKIEDPEDSDEARQFSGVIKAGGLPEGVYKLELKVNNDIVTEIIKSKQRKFSLINRFELAKQSEEELDIFSDCREIFLTTIHPDRLQTVNSASSSVELTETYKQFSGKTEKASSSDKFAKLEFTRDGIIVGGGCVFSFSEEAFLSPRLKKAIWPLQPVEEGVEFVIARYQSPKQEGKYSVLISVPGLLIEDERFVEIDEVRVELAGQGLWGKIKEYF